MAFHFVDRITEIEPGKMARGEFSLPGDLAHVPSWLVAEAIGQLAAWAAMARAGFRTRPVAALAGEVAVDGVRTLGKQLSLSVVLDRCDSGVVFYHGTADLDGMPRGRLRRCVGPMLPMEEFDDPGAVERRFSSLCEGASVRPVSAASLPADLPFTVTTRSPATSLSARLQVPESAPFFADHFPRRPVFPATLLVHIQSRIARELAGEALEASGSDAVTLVRVRNVKVRAFTAPGQVLDISAQVRAIRSDGADIGVTAEAEGKCVATASVEVARAT